MEAGEKKIRGSRLYRPGVIYPGISRAHASLESAVGPHHADRHPAGSPAAPPTRQTGLSSGLGKAHPRKEG